MTASLLPAPSGGTPPLCDCCGASAWEYAFTESDVDLGRCAECGLYYVAQMPKPEDRLVGVAQGISGGRTRVSRVGLHLQQERIRSPALAGYVELAKRFAPPGKWLELGSGTGTLLGIARRMGVEIEGIELNAERFAYMSILPGLKVYDRPIEELDFAPASFAAVIMINVFSHLIRPRQTLQRVHDVLGAGGILLMKTGELGPGARRKHAFRWELGDHLYFLGEQTIERYADQIGFAVIHRERQWAPAARYTRETFSLKGRSALRNFIKTACRITPGALPLIRWYVLGRMEADNPGYSSTLILRKAEPKNR